MKIVFLAAALLLPMSTPAQAPEAAAEQPRGPAARRELVSPDRAGCTPISWQVGGDDRAPRGTRLDQQPPAQRLLAVDREVGGCREVTFVRESDRPRR